MCVKLFIHNLQSNYSVGSVHWRNYNWVFNKHHCRSISAKYLRLHQQSLISLLSGSAKSWQAFSAFVLSGIDWSLTICLLSFVFCLLSFVLLFCWQACSKALVFSVIDLVPLSTSPHPQVTIACLPEGRLLARQKLSKWPFPSEKVELDCSVRAGKQIGADSQKPSWPAGVP